MNGSLQIIGLNVEFSRKPFPTFRPVRGIDLSVASGQSLAIVGETGCGKTLTGLAILGLLPQSARAGGSIRLDGRELVTLPPADRAALRGGSISMVFQNPGTAFNPMFTIGAQIEQVVRLHLGYGRRDAQSRVLEYLGKVGLPDPRRAASSFPHELSGGMLQRAMIAMALVCGPRLLLLDEPTTALDVTVAQQILRLILSLQTEFGFTVVLITHNLGVVRDVCDTVAVMYAGRIVEAGPTADVLDDPLHPYTQGLLAALPGRGQAGLPLKAISGSVPRDVTNLSSCSFADRCPRVMDICRNEDPSLTHTSRTKNVACFAVVGQ